MAAMAASMTAATAMATDSNGQKQRATGNCSSDDGNKSNGSDSSKGINGARELRAEMEAMAVTAGKGRDGREGSLGDGRQRQEK